MQQTKDAMIMLLDTLRETDFFNIITFDGNIYYWPSSSTKTFKGMPDAKREAVDYIRKLADLGGTNINEALLAGIRLVKSMAHQVIEKKGRVTKGQKGRKTGQKNKKTEKQIDRKTERQKDRKTERQKD
jgi:hypothetical protein